MMNKKSWIALAVALSAAAVLLCLLFVKPASTGGRLSKLYISQEELDVLTASRTGTDSDLIEYVSFDGYELAFDKISGGFWHSKTGNADPKASFKCSSFDVEISVCGDKIIAYTDRLYRIYPLNSTDLPVMQIEGDKMTLFDNGKDPLRRVTTSDIKLNANDKGWKFSLIKYSVGRHRRDNPLSLLGMPAGKKWRVIKAEEFPDKTNSEYKPVELFFDGEYAGVYILTAS
ncbi:MAG: hypothetical protein IJL87_09060 [Clostridia bacterium]|nr:hypothetical protein [Clostridia bacterium]